MRTLGELLDELTELARVHGRGIPVKGRVDATSTGPASVRFRVTRYDGGALFIEGDPPYVAPQPLRGVRRRLGR